MKTFPVALVILGCALASALDPFRLPRPRPVRSPPSSEETSSEEQLGRMRNADGESSSEEAQTEIPRATERMCKCMHAMKPTDAEKQEAKNHARECADGKFQVPDPPEDREHQQHQQHQQREHDADPNAPVDLQSCQRRLRFLYRQQRQEIRKIQKQLNDDEEAQVLQDYGSCIVRKLKLVTDDGRQIRREFFTEEIDKKFGAYPDIKRGLLEKLNGECSQYTKGEDWEKMVNCLWQYCAAA